MDDEEKQKLDSLTAKVAGGEGKIALNVAIFTVLAVLNNPTVKDPKEKSMRNHVREAMAFFADDNGKGLVCPKTIAEEAAAIPNIDDDAGAGGTAAKRRRCTKRWA